MSLRHAELKAARALEHLEALEAELEQYYSASPWSGVVFLKPHFKTTDRKRRTAIH
jgi:hypothetical protein